MNRVGAACAKRLDAKDAKEEKREKYELFGCQ